MKTLIIVCSLIACVLAATLERHTEIFRVERASCRSEFEKLGKAKGKTHTMCDSKYKKETSGSVSKAEKQAIINKHNALRSDPKTTETAEAMCKVYWDDEIAEIAQYYADTCPKYGPDSHDKMRDVPGYGISVGQNMAWGQTSWNNAIQDWFDEVKDFAFGKGSINGKAVGHYTQVVKDTTCRIGCGFANCGGKRTYVCNYATGQQGYKTPFVKGTACAACLDNCENNLCDCKGKMCYNGGTMDYNTCTCSCTDMYSGDSCQTLNCKSDKSYCGKPQPNGYPASFCTKYTNVPGECPVMCSTCKADGSAGDNFVPAPATKLLAGNGETGKNFDAGNVVKSGNAGGNKGGNSGGGTGGKSGCSADRDFCTTWVKQDWCDYGNNMKLTYNGEEGTPYSFCPHKCKQC